MILYSWKKIYKESKGNSSKILDIIAYLTYRPVPLNIKDPIYNYKQINWSGNSFLVNPEYLSEYRKEFPNRELAEYVGVASFRSYAAYKFAKTVTLDLACCPISQDIINNNRLLDLKDDKIYFRWEEVTRR